MAPESHSRHRKRQFCATCGQVHRNRDQCGIGALTPTPSPSGIPDQPPYPYSVSNLLKTSRELCDLAVIKQSAGLDADAERCRQLAARRLREAAVLDPNSATYYNEQASRIQQQCA